MATHSSILGWRIPWTKEPGGLQFMQSQRDKLNVGIENESESEVAQSCPTLCDSMDCSLLGSSVHEILQARVLEWVAISFSRGSSRPRDLGWDDALEKGKATHTSILACRIPWTKEPGGLQSMGLQKSQM